MAGEFDSNNYVAAVPGGYVTVVNGQQMGGVNPNQTAAEQAYNTAMGLSNGPAASGGYPVMGGGYGLDLAGMWANQAAQNQLARDRFNQLEIPQFDWSKQLGGMSATGWYRPDGSNIAMATQGGQGALPTFDREKYYSSLLASLSGPRDWVKYQQMLNGPASGSLGANAGMWGTPRAWGAVQATPSWEQMAAQYNATGSVAPQGRAEPSTTAQPGAVRAGDGGAQTQATTQANGWGIPTDVLQPHKLTAQQLGNMSGTQREMQSGLWRAQGLDANDMWQRAYRAQPQGQAAKGTTWRGTW